MIIVPIRDLKDTAQIEKKCNQENGPIFVTKNGYGKLVVMNIEFYEKMMKLIEAKYINDALSEVENGKIIKGESFLNELKGKYDF